MGEQPIRCGVVGVGRMGRHHARVYTELPGVKLVGVADADEERRETVAERHGCPAFETVEQLIDAGVQAVSVAVPTIHHLRVAEPLLKKGIACLIEKPLAPDVDTARELASLADATGAILMVGHIERFNPVIRAMRATREPDETGEERELIPRFMEVHRVSPLTFRSIDVGVVLDMMIHDLDVILTLVGCEPIDVQASAVAVIGEPEDVCNARLTFVRPDGRECFANVTASRLAIKTERKMRVIGEDFYLSVDYALKRGVIMRKTANEEQLREVREAIRAGADLSDLPYEDLVKREELRIDDQEPLKLELSEFVRVLREGGRPEIDAAAGFAAVRTAQRIVEAARRGLRMPDGCINAMPDCSPRS
ncbi:MAG: Gfo/Idh/MocA family oxidoreductase [Phycisphaerales bacterium]|nr:Gfo/Idh/MocA family oxidoreductase [Phycisphaerales bacterium]